VKRRGKRAKRDKQATQEKLLDALIAELLRLRAHYPPLSNEEIRRIRQEGRP
jgi:hypothetical protein